MQASVELTDEEIHDRAMAVHEYGWQGHKIWTDSDE